MMMIDYSVKYCFPNVAIFLAGLTHVPVQNLTIDSAYHDDIIPSMFELQSAKEINDIIQMSLSSNHPLICNIRNPIMSYTVGYLLAVTHCKWRVNILNMTSDVAHCFCCGFKTGGGQCDPEQISKLQVRLTCPNDYYCMLKLPKSFLEIVPIFSFFHDCHTYTSLYLLGMVWAMFPNLIAIEYNLSPPFINSTLFHRSDGLLLSVNDIWSLFLIIFFFRDTGIFVYTHSCFNFHYLSETVVWFFWVRSYMNCHDLTISYVEYSLWFGYVRFYMSCRRILSPEVIAEWFWFANMSPTELEDIAHNYLYNPYLHLSVVNLTAHLTTITITSTLHCPQSTVTLLYHIFHHSLLPCTVTSLNLTHTSSTIVHHLLPALSHNHQLICWRITDCSLFLRAPSSPIPLSFLQWKALPKKWFHPNLYALRPAMTACCLTLLLKL